MIQARPVKFALAALTLTLGSLTASASAAVDPFDGNWHFSLTPYLWLPNINADLDFDLPPRAAAVLGTEVRRLSAEVGPNDYLSNLQFALMLSGEARKGV